MKQMDREGLEARRVPAPRCFFLMTLFFLALLFVGGYSLFPRYLFDCAIYFGYNKAGLQLKSVKIADGVISYYDGGRGEPLIFLHGFGSGKRNFIKIATHLTKHYRVIIPDLMGFGDSSKIDGLSYKPSTQVRRMEQFAQVLGLKGALHLGGSSMGGQIALTWAAKHPQRVKSLWLMSPSGLRTAPKSELMLHYEKTGNMPLLINSVDDFFLLREWVMHNSPYVPDAFISEIAKENLIHKNLFRKILIDVHSESVDSILGSVSSPTLLVWGGLDRVISVHGATVFKRDMKNIKVVTMRNVGHLPYMENEEQVLRDYFEFRHGLR